MTDWSSLLASGLAAMRLDVPGAQRAQLLAYLELLDRWNRTINLTSLEPAARVRRLVLEPLWLAQRLSPAGRYLDVGSGNGSPAIPWCVGCAFSSASLVESRARRAVFLDVVVRRLGFPAVRVWQARLNALGEPRPSPDWVTVQGVRLDRRLLGEIRELNRSARVVWFTRGGKPPEWPAQRIPVPGEAREALIFDGSGMAAPGQP